MRLRDTFSCMLIQHEKSPCCRGAIRRFGGRRRQCIVCLKTWSVWRRKQGKKRLRVSVDLAHRFVFARLLPTRAERSGHPQSRNERQYRLAASRHQCAASCPWPSPPETGTLIAVADALVKRVGRRWRTVYLILVRPVEDDEAIILPPFHREGTETVIGWRQAFDALPEGVRSRIAALVCDGHRGLVHEALWRGWVLQRCHFHLIARIQGRLSKWRTGRNSAEGHRIFSLVKHVLTAAESVQLHPAITRLEECAWDARSPELKGILSGFVNHYMDYRAYLKFPGLRLPTTNNTTEALISCIEELCRRARGFTSFNTFCEWTTALVKTRCAIKCRPQNQQS